jgi:hypothetical protein
MHASALAAVESNITGGATLRETVTFSGPIRRGK